jgi:hypothetical protein
MRIRCGQREYFPHWLFLLFLICSQASLAQPVKLSVKVDKRTVQVGETVGVTVALLDANNRNMRARKPYAISVQVSLPSRKVEPLSGSIAVGQDTVQLNYKTKESGITRIRASHGELRAGSTSLNVRPRGGAAARSLVRPQVRVAAPSPPQAAPPPQMRARSMEVARDTQPAPPARLAVRPGDTLSGRQLTRPPARAAADPAPDVAEAVVPAPEPDPPRDEVAPPPAPAALSGKHLQLDYNPQRGLKADGRDTVEIVAYLMGAEEPPSRDVIVRLHASAGNLAPRPMTNKAGEWEAVSWLTSNQTGAVEVNYVDSNPSLPLAGDEKLEIVFTPPIWSLRVTAAPPEITFLGDSNILVELLDQNDNPVETDVAREVQVAITGGNGELEKGALTIPAGSAAASSGFTPSSWGAVTFSASSAGLRTAVADIAVTFPFLLLSFSAIGGSVGGAAGILDTQAFPLVANRQRRGRRTGPFLALRFGYSGCSAGGGGFQPPGRVCALRHWRLDGYGSF